MLYRTVCLRGLCYCLLVMGLLAKPAPAAEVPALIAAIKSAGQSTEGFAGANAAVKELAQQSLATVPTILLAMRDANPNAVNYLRSAVEVILDRAAAKGEQLAPTVLEKFIADHANGDRGRRMAYELLTKIDPQTPDRYLPDMLDDPSLELRRDAVAKLIRDTDAAVGEKPASEAALAAYKKAFAAARDIDQIESLAKKLRDAGQTVDLPRQLGFLMEWQLLAPFDNTNQSAFNIAYPPEEKIDLKAKYQGKSGEIAWQAHTTNSPTGEVDLNAALGKIKGAVAYAYTEFDADKGTDCQFRLGCINANKIWLNGELIWQREVYHAANAIDQYIAPAKLKPGKNTILLKICQNEQTEQWAQDWMFQLRVCDSIGTAILAANRPETPAAALSPKPAETPQ
ncbi:MAG: hypothetical protein SFX18_06545 [Pirellulales bacterium]|nr:hypothetical protein [Pirellulales bacterium]